MPLLVGVRLSAGTSQRHCGKRIYSINRAPPLLRGASRSSVTAFRGRWPVIILSGQDANPLVVFWLAAVREKILVGVEDGSR